MTSSPYPVPAASPSVASQRAPVQIDVQSNGGVVVRQDFPAQERKSGLKVMACVAAGAGGVLLTAGLLVWLGTIGWFGLLIAAVFCWAVVYRMARQYAVLTRAYVIRADAAGLTIEITSWRGHASRQFMRNQIDDITLQFPTHSGPKRSIFRSVLIVKTNTQRDVHCLQNVSGDQLAKAADALRAALKMPARSWP